MEIAKNNLYFGDRYSLHKNIKWIATFMQFVGMFPVEGLRKSDPENLTFKLISWSMLNFAFCWICVCSIGVIYTKLMLERGFHIWSVGKQVLT